MPKEFICPHCQTNTFNVDVQFDYSDGCCDLLEDEPDEKVEDFFSNIIVQGACTHCGKLSRVIDMDL